MTRIALDYTPAYEQGGGIGRYVRELVAALAQRDTETNYSLFVSGAAHGSLPPPPGDNFCWSPTRLNPRTLARLWHRLRVPLPIERFTGEVALFHATDFVLPPTHPTTRTLLTVHDLSFVRVPEAASPSLKAYLDRVVPRSVQRADHILADSTATKNDLIDLYNTPPEKVTVLLSGVDARFSPITDTDQIRRVRSKYALGDTPYILSVGTVQPRKNYARLVEALASLRRQNHDVNLVIVGGRGWLESPIYETVNKTEMQQHVYFTGFVDEQDLPTLYNAATCLAFPSLYEGFGLPVLEAMACDTPVLTSNVSSLPEVAGNAALLVDPYDLDDITNTLSKLITDTTLRKTLIARGRERIKHFTWQRAARQLHSLYQSMTTHDF